MLFPFLRVQAEVERGIQSYVTELESKKKEKRKNETESHSSTFPSEPTFKGFTRVEVFARLTA